MLWLCLLWSPQWYHLIPLDGRHLFHSYPVCVGLRVMGPDPSWFLKGWFWFSWLSCHRVFKRWGPGELSLNKIKNLPFNNKTKIVFQFLCRAAYKGQHPIFPTRISLSLGWHIGWFWNAWCGSHWMDTWAVLSREGVYNTIQSQRRCVIWTLYTPNGVFAFIYCCLILGPYDLDWACSEDGEAYAEVDDDFGFLTDWVQTKIYPFSDRDFICRWQVAASQSTLVLNLRRFQPKYGESLLVETDYGPSVTLDMCE